MHLLVSAVFACVLSGFADCLPGIAFSVRNGWIHLAILCQSWPPAIAVHERRELQWCTMTVCVRCLLLLWHEMGVGQNLVPKMEE